MHMLHAGGLEVVTDGIRSADESNPQGYYELEQVKTLHTPGDHSWLAEARGKAVKIVSFLLTYLPESHDYQVIFMRRDLDEILASQHKMLSARAEAQGASDDRMRVHYEQHLAQVQRFLTRRACFSTLMLDYTDVVADPGQAAVQISRFLGRRLDLDRMVAVVNPALYRTRRATG